MNTQESMKYCKDKIEEYEKEIQKLEKQKMEYLEVDKVLLNTLFPFSISNLSIIY